MTHLKWIHLRKKKKSYFNIFILILQLMTHALSTLMKAIIISFHTALFLAVFTSVQSLLNHSVHRMGVAVVGVEETVTMTSACTGQLSIHRCCKYKVMKT
jgi:hypothetical protein